MDIALKKTLVINKSIESNEILNQKPNQTLNQKPNEILNQKPNEILNQKSNKILNQKPNQTLNQKPNQTLNKKPNQTLNQKSNEILNQKSNEILNQKSNEILNPKPNQTLNQKIKNISHKITINDKFLNLFFYIFVILELLGYIKNKYAILDILKIIYIIHGLYFFLFLFAIIKLFYKPKENRVLYLKKQINLLLTYIIIMIKFFSEVDAKYDKLRFLNILIFNISVILYENKNIFNTIIKIFNTLKEKENSHIFLKKKETYDIIFDFVIWISINLYFFIPNRYNEE
jgi:hypothetical protein